MHPAILYVTMQTRQQIKSSELSELSEDFRIDGFQHLLTLDVQYRRGENRHQTLLLLIELYTNPIMHLADA